VPKSDDSVRTENRTAIPPRAPLVYATIFCWLAAGVAIAAAVYAYTTTPNVITINFEVSREMTGQESKLQYLFLPIVWVVFIPVTMSYPVIGWDRDKMIKREQDWREFAGDAYPLGMSHIMLMSYLGFSACQIIIVSVILYRCIKMLGMA
jgi:hypothetical protein